MKPDVSNIKAALSNLPKTLEETYDRIFLDIPEDDWLSVQHVFHWLKYHKDLFRDNISLSTLLQAVQKSTIDCLSHSADQLYDFEGLRERCGCLILVEKEKSNRDNLGRTHERTTVSFAHYTVKEYLQSPRILKKKLGYFALDQERIEKEFAEIAFRQALAIPPGILDDYEERYNAEYLFNLSDGDFSVYCGISSVAQLNTWSEIISCDPTMVELSEALVNPCRLGSKDLSALLDLAQGCDNRVCDISDIFDDTQFWNVHWNEKPSRHVAVFLCFLLMSGERTTHLALAFAKKHSMFSILTEQFSIEKEIWELTNIDFTSVKLEGTIPEMVAQWAFRQPLIFNFILDLISEQGWDRYNATMLLLLYIGAHRHDTCNESCPLETLLKVGANACGPEEAFVTPLQIAVQSWDLRGVQVLLNAGAEPNNVGSGISKWAPGSPMERFNHLHGLSPLHIIRNFECIYDEDLKDELKIDDVIREDIENCLIQFGGVDVWPDYSDSESVNLIGDPVEV